MSTMIAGSLLPLLMDGTDTEGVERALYEFCEEGRLTLYWWHPQFLSPASCKTCNNKTISEPVKLISEIYESGCNIVGLTYESPERMKQYLYDIGIEYPILTVTPNDAKEHGAAKASGEPWESIPRRIAYLVNESEEIINRYEVNDSISFLRSVRDDVKNGPPASMWPEPKRKKFLGIF